MGAPLGAAFATAAPRIALVTRSRVCGASATRTASRSTRTASGPSEVTLTEAARILNLNPLTVLRQIHAGIIPAEQCCKGAPWVIKRRSIEDPDLVERVKMCRKGPSSSNPDQKTLVFQ
jgi:hypothetical protein